MIASEATISELQTSLVEPRIDSTMANSDELFRRNYEAIFRFFSRRVSDKECVKDLTAETFAACAGRRTPRNIEPICWLYGIARRKFADHLRREEKRKRLNDIRPGGATDSRTKDQADQIRDVISGLPHDQREALMFQILEELSVAEIAKVMGRSEGSTKSLIQRAKETVRRELEKARIEEGTHEF